MTTEFGSLAQWASATFAGISAIVSICSFSIARKASRTAVSASNVANQLRAELTSISVRLGGAGGSGGTDGGGGGGGGGGFGAPGGDGGSVSGSP